MERTYLFVEPEDGVRVKALGARWDDASKRWYIECDQAAGAFARWLPGSEDGRADEEEFTIVSSHAFVASAIAPCQRCHATIEVICIHCEDGTVLEELLTQFTVSHISAMDEMLARQLRRWPHFLRTGDAGDEVFANHCPHCNMPQDDLYLHSEPEQMFFDVPEAVASGLVRLAALEGLIRLSGDEHFQVGRVAEEP